MSLIQFQNSESVALNGQSVFKSKAGNFTLQFELSGSANMALDLNSIRLCANVDFLTGAGQHLNNNNLYGLGVRVGAAAAVAIPNPVPPGAVAPSPAYSNADQSFIDVDCRTGVSACVNSVLFQDAENNSLENVYSYPHMMNKVCSLTMSKDDSLTWAGSKFGIRSGGKSIVNQQALNSTQDVALKLYTGISESDPMPYSIVKGKLKISIQLNSSSSVFHSGANEGQYYGIGTDRASEVGGCFYALSNVKLTYRNLIFNDDQAPQLNAYSYRHFSSLQSTITASNNTNIYNPNSSNAISILTSFIPSQNLNNYSKNSIQSDYLKNQTPIPADIYPKNVPQSVRINSVDFLKNNVSFPLQYPIDESIYTKNNDGNFNYEVQRSLYYLTTLNPYEKMRNCLIEPSTENYGPFTQANSPDWNVPVAAGVGIRYAAVSGMDGTSFQNGQSFQQKIDSGLNSTLTNEMFSSVMSTKKIIPSSASGPVVLS